MKVRKLLLLTVVLSLVGGTVIFADAVSQQIRVIFNKEEMDDGGTLIDGKAYLGIRSLSDSLQAIVIWDDDTKKVNIYKPNVHMFLMQGNKPFGSVSKGKGNFRVFSQIDNLQTSITAFKVTITDPYGDDTWIDGRSIKDDDFPTDKDNFWFTTDDTTYDFKYAGKYTVRFWMKASESPTMQVVSEKTLIAK